MNADGRSNAESVSACTNLLRRRCVVNAVVKTRWVSAIAPMVAAACVACASSNSGGGAVAPHQPDTVDHQGEDGESLAKLLEDNGWAIAQKKKHAADGDAVASEADDAAQKKTEEEEAAALAAKEKDRVAAEAAMKRAQAALESKDYDAAAKNANEAIALDGKDYPYAYVILGDTFFEAHDYGNALESYKRAMELDPDDGWAANRAAQALQKLKRLKEARDVLQKFVDAHPDADADTLDALAWIELDLGDTKAAQKSFERAEKLADGKDAEAWYGLAMIAAGRKDAAATQKALEALFALEPERRVVLERDPTFFRMRLYPGVKALFSPQKMAEAQKIADAKKKGLPVGGGPSADEAVAKAKAAIASTTFASGDDGKTKLAVPGGGSVTIDARILFAFDSAKLEPESKKALDGIAKFLDQQAKSIDFVEIEGHADKIGDDAYNVKLSEKRATVVRDALVARGVSATLLTAKGYGNFCPLDAGDDAKNRRVQFAIGAGGKVAGDELTCTEKMRKWLKPRPAISKLFTVK
jgi:outer membrane protein OmpA-like peptidoglycan-associated protein/Tfp pilus assembly protein PilF